MTRNIAWLDAAACQGTDPEAFTVDGNLTNENLMALAICSTCPVQEACHDSYLDLSHRPMSVIAGGLWWDAAGRLHTPADGRVEKPKVPAVGISRHLEGARRAITAARAKQALGLTYSAAVSRYGTNLRAVCDAVAISRYAPELLDEVWNGRSTLSAAFTEATGRRRRSELDAIADTTARRHTRKAAA